MQHYWGAKVIAKRLGVGMRTLDTWIKSYGLPVYLRLDPRCAYRRMLYTNDRLLDRWEDARVADYRERRLAGKDVSEPQRIQRLTNAQIQRRMRQYSEPMVDHGQLSAENPDISAN